MNEYIFNITIPIVTYSVIKLKFMDIYDSNKIYYGR